MLPVRTISREQLEWRVYEANTRAVPGAPADSCLIFNSDAIVRRCWAFPENWASLDDDALWGLLGDGANRSAVRPPARDAVMQSGPQLVVGTPSDSESRLRRDSTRALREERDALLASCPVSRAAMLDAVGRYAAMLKKSGVSPEATIVLIKEAIRDGLGGAAQAEAPDGLTQMGDGVAHAIKTYYAA
jgi:hypothetical protein